MATDRPNTNKRHFRLLPVRSDRYFRPYEGEMIDLHCHILPGLDDGAADLSVSLAMARAFVADGVRVVACTPHILPGLYHNTGPAIIDAARRLQTELDREGIPLRLVTGADVHIAPDVVSGLRDGRIPSLAGSRYVLIEPPHHVAPARMEDLFFNLLVAGYVPILTHPERLTWIRSHYATIERLAQAGVWMQITAGSLTGAFGRQPLYWAERMLDDAVVHIVATDAHDVTRRPPILAKGRDVAARRVGEDEARHLVETRPQGVLANAHPLSLPVPAAPQSRGGSEHVASLSRADNDRQQSADQRSGARSFTQRLRDLFH